MKFLHLALITGLLSGCIDTGNKDSEPSNSSATINFEGKVADGYLVNAKVCLDLNENNACDVDEPFAISTAGGVFSLSGVTQAQVDSYPILVEVIAGESYDEDNNDPSIKIQTAYKLTAPAGSLFISPITTIVKSKMDGGLSLQASIDEVEDVVGDGFDPTKDYVAAQESNELTQAERDLYEKGHKIAQVIASLISDKLAESDSPSLGEAIVVIEEKLAEINTKIEENPDTGVEDIKNTLDISCEFCGIWHKPETEDTAGSYLVIRSDNGNADYFVIDDVNHDQTIQECFSDDSRITTVAETGANWRWYNSTRDIADGEPAYYDFTLGLTNENTGLNATHVGGEVLEFTKITTIPVLCEDKVSAIRTTNLHGVWIGEYINDISGSVAGAYIFNEDGSGMFLDGFEANNESCEDFEMEFNWGLSSSDLTLIYTGIENGSMSGDGAAATQILALTDFTGNTVLFPPKEIQTGTSSFVTLTKKLTLSSLTPTEVKNTCSSLL